MSDEPQIHILLIEDDEDFRDLLFGLLKEEGYRVTAVSSGEEALEQAARGAVDLVVADVKLGGMDGLDALSELRGQQAEFQSLVMTGYSTEADSIRAVKLGVGNYLKKPFTIKDFLRAVEDLSQKISQERLMREREQALLETVAWALQSLLQSCPEVAEPGALSRRVREAGARCGLGQVSALHVCLAVLASLVKRYAVVTELGFFFKGLPPAVSALLETLPDERSLEHDLVRYGLSIVEGDSVDVRAEVVSAYEESQDTECGSQRLLPLGLALERSGDLLGAESVFGRLIRGSKRRRERVAGHLGQARVYFAQGETAKAVEELELVTSQEQGSSLAAEAHLERGVLQARMGKREPALSDLKLAHSLFSTFGDELGRVRSELALAALGKAESGVEGHLRTLMLPQNLEHFFQSANWLFPFLVRELRGGASSPELRRGLRRFLGDLPGFCSNWIRHNRSEEAIVTVLTLLAEEGVTGYKPLFLDLASHSSGKIRSLTESLLTQEGQAPRAPGLRLFGLGRFEAFVGDRRVPVASWRGQKSTYLLSYLALHLGKMVTRESLVEHFWPDSGERGYRSLSQLLQVIRRALQPPDWPGQLSYIRREGQSLGLETSVLCWHDAVEVEACLERATGAPGEEGAQELSKAFELYGGRYLESCYMDWVVDFRRVLEQRLIEGGLRLSQIRLGQERASEALEVAQTVLGLDSLCQQATLRSMEAQVKLGRPEEALRLFEQCEKRLQTELEIEPSTDLLRAVQLAKLAL